MNFTTHTVKVLSKISVISRHILSLFIAISIINCGSKTQNDLHGSISQMHALDFENVEVRYVVNEGIAIVYTQDIPGAVEKEQALNLLYDPTLYGLKTETNLSLVNTSGLSRFRLNIVSGLDVEDRAPFPTVIDGNIYLETFSIEEGSQIVGRFEVTFNNGLTLFGDFDAPLQHVSSNALN